MLNNYEEIDALLAKKFAGEASPQDERQIENWLKTDPKNAQYLAEMQWIWEKSAAAQAAQPDVDTERALQKVKQKIRPTTKIVAMNFWRLAAAAALVLAIAAVWFFKNQPAAAPLEIANASLETLADTLADGSEIVLNRNSGLAIAPDFGKHERRTRLRGEAFFKIAADKTRPFVVEIEKLEVEVVGTEFNIFENLTTVEVEVLEGKVQLRGGGQQEFLMAGEAAVFEKSSGKIMRQQPNPNVLAYQNRQFLFDGTPLRLVAEQLSKVYGIEISFKNERLADCRLSARYDDLPLARVLDLIAETFNFSISKTGDAVVFDGSGCN